MASRDGSEVALPLRLLPSPPISVALGIEVALRLKSDRSIHCREIVVWRSAQDKGGKYDNQKHFDRKERTLLRIEPLYT
jgi:hypothetical protein